MAGVVLSPSSVSVAPGGDAVCTVTIRNSSAVVESFVVTVLGDAAGWATVTPATVSLFPGTDGSVEVRFRPPRASSPQAGPVDFAVRVAATQADDSTVEEGIVEIQPFVELTAHITPRTSEAKRKAKHVVAVDNKGNAPVTVSVTAADPDEALAFEATPSTLTIAPGDSEAASIGVAARSGFARGPAQHRPFQATITPPAGSTQLPITLDANFVQKAGMPSFVPVVVAAAVILLAAAIVVPGLTKGDDKGGTFSLTGAAGSSTTVAAASAGGEGGETEAEAEVEVASGGGGTDTTAAPATTAPSRAPTAVAGSGGQASTATTQPAAESDPPVTTAPQAPTAVASSLPKPKAGLPILFPSFEGDTDEEIWKINPDGSGKQKLTSYPQPQWSVGGKWNYAGTLIAFTHANGPVHAWIMNADGSNQHDATPACGTNCSQPAFSPDGKLFSYVRETATGSGTYDIWVADVSTTGVTSNHRALVATGDNEQYPAFAPDGRLAFQRLVGGSWRVIVRQTNGAENTAATGFHPAWSPNNDRLLYSDGNEVWSVRPDGSGATNVSNAPSSAEQWPSFSPDGGRVLFSTTRWDGGQWNVAFAEMNGAIVKQITGATGRHWWIGWF